MTEAGNWQNITYEVDYEKSKDLVDLCAIIFDLQSVIEACDVLLSLMQKEQGTDTDNLIIEHLWSSVLVKYFRCFTTGKRKLLLSPLEDIFSAITTGDPIALHKYFNHTRNKHIAHSVNDQEVLKVGISIDPNELKILGFSTIIARRTNEHPDTTRDFQTLAKVALQYAQSLYPKIEANALILAEAEGVEELMKRPNYNLLWILHLQVLRQLEQGKNLVSFSIKKQRGQILGHGRYPLEATF